MLRFPMLSPIPYSSMTREGRLRILHCCLLQRPPGIVEDPVHPFSASWILDLFMIRSNFHFCLKSGCRYFGSLLWRLNYAVRMLSQAGTVRAERPWLQQQECPGWPWSELALKLRAYFSKKIISSVTLKPVCTWRPYTVLEFWVMTPTLAAFIKSMYRQHER